MHLIFLKHTLHRKLMRVWVINKAKIPVQELDSQRGEGAYFEGGLFSEDTVKV